MEVEPEKGEDITYSVDIPKINEEGKPQEEWYCVEYFTTEKEAIEYAIKYFGADENGNINLISRF